MSTPGNLSSFQIEKAKEAVGPSLTMTRPSSSPTVRVQASLSSGDPDSAGSSGDKGVHVNVL